MKRFPPPPNTSDLNEPSWRHWFYLIADALNRAVDITTSSGVLSSSQGTFPTAGMNGEILEGDSHEYIMSPGTSLSFDAATRFLASSTGMGVTLPLFTATEAGLTPLSGGGTSNFLRADGTWATTGSGSGREILSTNRTYYVRTDGSNSNTGLANTAGGAFLTIQKAIDVICSTLDISAGVTCTVQIADGTYTDANTVRSIVGPGAMVIQGNSGTPANVVISTTSGHCFAASRTAVTIKDLKMQTTTSGWAIVCTGGASVTYSNVNFGACANGHIYVSTGGAVSSSTSYAISGAAPVHVQASLLGEWQSTGGTVTITGTPAFSTGFVVSSNVAAIYAGGTTYSGSATGKRYDATLNATISSNGGGANFFPGDTAGSYATGGQYA